MIKTRMKDHNCGELNLNNVNEEVTLYSADAGSAAMQLQTRQLDGLEAAKRDVVG